MKREELIEELLKMPEGAEVCICDWRKNLIASESTGDDVSDGIYPSVVVEYVDDEISPFIALNFDNEDYLLD
jgi:hypothetical protein